MHESEAMNEREALDNDSAVRERCSGRSTAELHARVNELESFAYTVSHDLRAPLQHVIGYVELLEEHMGNSLDDEGRRLMATIVTASREMAALIDHLLTYARNGQVTLDRRPVDLGALVERVRRLVDPPESTIDWRIDKLPVVSGDERMLEQLLQNLVSNAVKFSAGRAEPVIEIVREHAPEGAVAMSVRDNGVGFDMERASELFEVFTRLHRGDRYSGHGIGLANVRRIVERHGGSVRAESHPGAGARFAVTLPSPEGRGCGADDATSD